MKLLRYLPLALLSAFPAALTAQIVITFEGSLRGDPIPLDSIHVENLTGSGDTTIYHPDNQMVLDENWPFASISREVAYRVQKDAFDFLDAPVLRVNQADVPLAFTPTLIDASLPSVPRVVKAVKEVVYVVK